MRRIVPGPASRTKHCPDSRTKHCPASRTKRSLAILYPQHQAEGILHAQ